MTEMLVIKAPLSQTTPKRVLKTRANIRLTITTRTLQTVVTTLMVVLAVLLAQETALQVVMEGRLRVVRLRLAMTLNHISVEVIG